MALTREWVRRISIFLLACAVPLASLATAWPETWVENQPIECGGSGSIRPNVSGWFNSDGRLDNDANFGSAEDPPSDTSDAVFSSIRQAVLSTNTSAGGVVHVPARGPYRDATTVTISNSVTVRGPTDADVVLTADCSGSASTCLTINIAAGDIVVLEHLTIRNYTKAIDISGSSGGTLILRDCNIEDGTTGIFGGSDPDVYVQVYDSRISGNVTAITAVASLSLVGSEVSNNSTSSIVADEADWFISGSVIADNGAGLVSGSGDIGTGVIEVTRTQVVRNASHGISINNGIFALTLHDSHVSRNVGDGVKIKGSAGSTFTVADTVLEANSADGLNVENNDGCVALDGDTIAGVVMHSRLVHNGSDGISHGGNGTSCSFGNVQSMVTTGLLDNAISGNGAYGLNERTASSSFHCQVGENLLSYNGTAPETGTGTVCTAANTSSNQAN